MSLFNLYFLTKLYTYTPSKLKKWILGEPNILHQSGCFTRIGEFTRRVSECEELVGLLTGDDGVGLLRVDDSIEIL